MSNKKDKKTKDPAVVTPIQNGKKKFTDKEMKPKVPTNVKDVAGLDYITE